MLADLNVGHCEVLGASITQLFKSNDGPGAMPVTVNSLDAVCIAFQEDYDFDKRPRSEESAVTSGSSKYCKLEHLSTITMSKHLNF
jgi:hypothetical protein